MAVMSAIIWPLISLVSVVYLVYRISRLYLQYLWRCKALMLLPGEEPDDYVQGHISEFPGMNEEGLQYLVETAKEYPKLVYVFAGPFPSVDVYHPETAKALFKTSEPKPLNFFGPYRFTQPWLGNGLLITGGAQWARNRRLLTPAFHFDILKPYMNVNNQAVEILMEKLQRTSETKEYLELFYHLSLCTLDVILRCAFSYESNCQVKGESHPYVRAVKEMTEAMPERFLSPWLYPDVFYYLTKAGRNFKKNCKLVHTLAEDIIKKRKETQAQVGVTLNKRYLDFLDILLTAKDTDGKGLTDEQIRQEVDTFMFAGHDTTASGISWMLNSLAKHPEHMRKCQEELDQVLGNKEEDTIEWDDLPKLKYLSMCLKESLRLHTPVPFIQRITTKDMYLDGYFIPEGTNVSLHLYVMLHNPYIWEKPYEFIPSRFEAEEVEKMDNFQFVPFSAGPRNCIGQNFAQHEMKVVVGRILRKYDLELKPGHLVEHEPATVMKAETGIYMRAKLRNP